MARQVRPYPPEIPERWRERVREHTTRTRGTARDKLDASDFRANQSLHLRFQDGSYALFRYAFYLSDEENEEVAVFTEHCGYHYFSLRGLTIETLPLSTGDE